MTIQATPVPGDPDVMLDALVAEFAGLGWDLESLLTLFRDPAYPMLYALRSSMGEAGLRGRIAKALERSSSAAYQAEVWEAPEEPEGTLVQIGAHQAKGDRHADRP